MLWSESDIRATIDAIAQTIDQIAIPDSLLCEFTDSAYDRDVISYLSAKGEGYYRFFPEIVRRLGLRNILELGTRDGLSAICIYSGLPADGRLITVDIDPAHRLAPPQIVGDPRVTFAIGDVCDLRTYGRNIPLNVDFLFSDTVHTSRQLRDELSIYQPLLADRALIAIDDINLNDKRELFEEWPMAKWDLTELCHGSGFGLLLYERREHLSSAERLLQAFEASTAVWHRRCDELTRALVVARAPPDSLVVRTASAVLPRPVKRLIRRLILRR